jgi:hypothetical protein
VTVNLGTTTNLDVSLPLGVDPVVQSHGPDLGTWSIGQIEMPLNATGGDGINYLWSVVGDLPPGMALRADPPSCCFQNASAGLIGVATTAGTYTFTLSVASGGQTADQVSTLRVTALTTKENQLPDAFVGKAFSYTLTALNSADGSNGLWTATSGMPAGMTLDPDGRVWGTPTTAGFYNAGFTLYDGTDTVNRGVSLRVAAIEITTPGVLPNATQGVTYPNTTITASGGTGPYTFSANGLPFGLSLISGVITGSVSSNNSSLGKVFVSVTASSNGASYTKTMSIEVVGATPLPPHIGPYGNALDDCTTGAPCNRSVGALSGGTAPFTWSALGLPAARRLRGTAWRAPGSHPATRFWGTPTATGLHRELTVMTDGATATMTFQMNVSPSCRPSSRQTARLTRLPAADLRAIGGRPTRSLKRPGSSRPA